MKKHEVILVNASEEMSSSVIRAITAQNVHIRSFSSPVDALNHLCDSEIIDLIITDLHFADMNGWRFCQLLRSPEFPHANHTPLMITSSIFRDSDLAAMACSIGANNYKSIPCDPLILGNTVQKVLTEKTPPSPVALIIEDDKTIAKFINSCMETYGYKVFSSETAAESLLLCREHQPDVIVLDHVLPDTNGLEILPHLIECVKQKDLVVIAMTAVSDPELAINYMQEGANAYIRKPFTTSYLIETINRAQRENALKNTEELLELRTKSLREINARFRDLYEHAPIGYHTLDPQGIILTMNATELGWLGYSPDEIIGRKTIFDLQTEQSRVKGMIMFKELKHYGGLKDAELELVRKDGSVMPVLIQSSVIRDEAGEFLSCRTVVRDVSDRRALEEQLRHAQKMESLGVMSVGIAHNFNNLLTPILVNSSDLASEFKEDSDKHNILQDIVDAAKRGSELVKQLITLGQTSRTQLELMDLQPLLTETMSVLRKTIDQSIRIETEISPDVVSIMGNSGQIQQCILNLCFNARDAMRNGGLLSINIQTSEITDDAMSISALAHAGKYVVLSVMDNGTGIPKDIQKKIFDPFFTTKGMAQGSGLGLSTVYGIMESHGGFIHLYSEPGEGSKFRLYFPCPISNTQKDDHEITAAGQPDRKPKQEPGAIRQGNECILLVDDEKDILHAAARILKGAGYTILQAQDGLTALDMIRRSMDREGSDNTIPGIDLVILDVVMPSMSGEKVLESLRAIPSEVPVVICSGFGNTPRVTEFLNMGAQAIVSKPFEKQALRDTVREVLDAR